MHEGSYRYFIPLEANEAVAYIKKRRKESEKIIAHLETTIFTIKIFHQ